MSGTPSIEDCPAPAPAAPPDLRRSLAREFLRGSGVEIGALHLALALPPGVSVRYVDRMSVDDLRHHYPELNDSNLVDVDVVDDGETLATLPERSLDFIVANHFLEHCQDPITTITTHLAKLRPGGILFYAVPDKRYTFDFRRARTPLRHVIEDHERGPERSLAEHYLQWATDVYPGAEPPSAQRAQAVADQFQAEDYSIHFHVWTATDLTELILHIQDSLQSFEIETIRRNGIENILILRRHGPPPPRARRAELAGSEPAPGLPGPVRPPPVPDVQRTRDTIALAALRGYRWPPSTKAHWSVDPHGIPGRGLVLPAAASWIVPLTLDRALRFRARVRLLPHDWRDGTRAVRATVAGIDGSGARRELWSAVVPARAAGGEETGLPVICDIPAGTSALVLSLQAAMLRDSASVARAVWLDPAIVDPRAPADEHLATAAVADHLTPRAGEGPMFSVLTPVHDPPIDMLRQAIDSVRAQSCGSWELCLVDDGSRDPAVIGELERVAADSRIRLERREHSGGISEATNTALTMAGGEYVVLLDHDDLLIPNALELVAAEIARRPELDVLYSDETVITGGTPTTQILKSGWAPESLATHMYMGHIGVYRRAAAQRAGGFRSEFDGCQDYEFALRVTELTDRVAHIPAQLYQWRAHGASTAGGGREAKPYAYLTQPRAIREHLARLGIDAEVQFGAIAGTHRIVHRVAPTLRVTVVLCPETLEEALAVAGSLGSQPHPAWRLVLAVPEDRRAALEEGLAGAEVPRGRFDVVAHGAGGAGGGGAPGRIARLDAAARAVDGDHLLLMDAPATGLTETWLTALAGFSAAPGVGAAGPVVLRADGEIAEAGYALPEGIALPLLDGLGGDHAPSVPLNVSAVGGMVMTSAARFAELGGLDPGYAGLAMIEYCVRLGDAGERTVAVPDARVQLVRPHVADNDPAALWRLRRRWIATHRGDPLYNPNLRTDRGDRLAQNPL